MPKDIKTTRAPDYTKHRSDWTTIKDCLDGQTAIKAKSTDYLPFPVALDDSIRKGDEFKSQYSIYLEGGVFVNHTSQAVEDLVAGIFKRDPIYAELPTELDDFDVNTLSRELTLKTTSFGRSFALVDYPTTDGQPTRDQENKLNIHAFAVVYDPTDVLDWEMERIGGTNTLKRVVLHETVVSEDGTTNESQFRELEMIENVYTVTMYDKDGQQKGDSVQPMAMGSTLDHITGTFVGVVSNSEAIDKSPVLGIAQSNIKHYQTWAELNHVQTYMGHPTLAITGAPTGFIKSAKDNNVRIGIGASNALVIEGDKATANIIEINGANIIHFKTLDKLEQSMTDQGARLRSSNKSGVESGEALRIRNSGDNSVMASIATNVETAVEDCVGFASEYMGVTNPDKWSLDLNKEFIGETLDSTIVRELSALVSAGQIPVSILHDYLKRVGVLKIDVDSKDLISQAKEENPVNVPFDNPTIEE